MTIGVREAVNNAQQFLVNLQDLFGKIDDLRLEEIEKSEDDKSCLDILTEVNSLANQLGEPERSQCFYLFSQVISQFEAIYIESRNITSNAKFIKFGLTDCGIAEIARNQYLVLTDDFKLANYLQTINIDTK